MSDFLNTIEGHHLEAAEQLEPHTSGLLRQYFDDEILIDLTTDPLVEQLCPNPYLFAPLRLGLPFGRVLTEAQKNHLLSPFRLTRLVNNSRSQLLYWFLRRSTVGPHREPVSSIHLITEADQFWFNHLANQRTSLTT